MDRRVGGRISVLLPANWASFESVNLSEWKLVEEEIYDKKRARVLFTMGVALYETERANQCKTYTHEPETSKYKLVAQCKFYSNSGETNLIDLIPCNDNNNWLNCNPIR